MALDTRGATIPDDLVKRFRASTPRFAGPTSVLYDGTDPASGKPLLIKVLRDTAIASASEKQRVLRELHKLSQVRHPALPEIAGQGEADGKVWIAREFIEGDSLAERIGRSGQLPVGESARIAGKIAAALVEMHRHGVLHRDVRPGHVMLTPAGAVKLLDGAVGRIYKTPDGRMAGGTPGYVAPESISGKLVSFRSDLYSLGATLYELLVGAPPFGPPSAADVLTAQSSRDLPPLGPPTPTALAKLVTALLSREPRERPFSAQQLERQLDPFASPLESPELTTVGAEATIVFPAVTKPAGSIGQNPPPLTTLEDARRAESDEEMPTAVASAIPPALMQAARAVSNLPPPPPPAKPPLPVSASAPSGPRQSAPMARAIAANALPGLGGSPVPARMAPNAAPSGARAVTPAPSSLSRKRTMLGIVAAAQAEPEIDPEPRLVEAAPSADAEEQLEDLSDAVSEASGQVSRPPPPVDIDDFAPVDTVVNEDSRIFGLPDISRGSPHGTAVPPLPDGVAQRVLTGPAHEGASAQSAGPMPTMPADPPEAAELTAVESFRQPHGNPFEEVDPSGPAFAADPTDVFDPDAKTEAGRPMSLGRLASAPTMPPPPASELAAMYPPVARAVRPSTTTIAIGAAAAVAVATLAYASGYYSGVRSGRSAAASPIALASPHSVQRDPPHVSHSATSTPAPAAAASGESAASTGGATHTAASTTSSAHSARRPAARAHTAPASHASSNSSAHSTHGGASSSTGTSSSTGNAHSGTHSQTASSNSSSSSSSGSGHSAGHAGTIRR